MSNEITRDDNVRIYDNTVRICGRLCSVRRVKRDEVRFKVLVAKMRKKNGTYEPLRDENGKIVSDVHTIRFFDKNAEHYENMFVPGDFVCVTAMAIDVRNQYTCKNKSDLFGVSIEPKRVGNYTRHDASVFTIRGKVTSLFERTWGDNTRQLVTLYVKSEKPSYMLDGTLGTVSYNTYVTVSIDSNSAKVLAKTLQKGDFVELRGRVVESVQKDTHVIQNFYHATRLSVIDRGNSSASVVDDQLGVPAPKRG